MISKYIKKLESNDSNIDLIKGVALGLFLGVLMTLVVYMVSAVSIKPIGLMDLVITILFIGGTISGLFAAMMADLKIGFIILLTYGLVAGVLLGLINISKLITPTTFNYILLAIVIIILGEFLFNGKGYTKKLGSKFWFTARRKAESLIESTIIIINSLNLYYLFVRYDLIRKIIRNLVKYFPAIMKWLGYIIIGILAVALVVLLLYLWIKLNESRVKK